MKDLFITIPHSGRKIPKEAFWLKSLPPSILYCDVDAFVDELYGPVLEKLKLISLVFPWHRYAVDVNRLPEDRTSRTVEGSVFDLNQEVSTEIHWYKTTRGDILMKESISKKRHELIMEKYYHPFHHKIREEFRKRRMEGRQSIYHLDLHSMPSIGRSLHRDLGKKRAQVVIGNREGLSADSKFSGLVLSSYRRVGFETILNWPYRGGRITELYGHPKKGQHTLQIEINRSLYMDEETGQKSTNFPHIQKRLNQVLTLISEGLKKARFAD